MHYGLAFILSMPFTLKNYKLVTDHCYFPFQSIPGGFNALRRLYTDIQEPMMNAAQEQVDF